MHKFGDHFANKIYQQSDKDHFTKKRAKLQSLFPFMHKGSAIFS